MVVKQLTLLQARFLWVGVIDRRHMHRLAWNLFIKEKDKGGLRMSSIIVKKIKSLLFKWIWRLGSINYAY
jgi:hypothetical protein